MNIIKRESGETFLIIREKYVALCNGNVVAAALIHIFEQWHVSKLRTRKQMRENSVASVLTRHQEFLIDGLYQWHTNAELESYLMGLAKKDTILAARRQLESMGIISEHKNPFSKIDNTVFFIFHPDQVNELLEVRNASEKIRLDVAGNSPAPKAEESSENRQYNKDSLLNSNKDFIVDRGSTDKSSTIPKNKPVKNNDKDWQWAKWVNAWFIFFQSKNDGRDPLFDGAQTKALKNLRKYLIKISDDGNADTDTDEAGLQTLLFIFNNWEKLDDWQRTVFDLTVIVKKINEFINRIKNGATTDRLADQHKNGISKSREQALRDY